MESYIKETLKISVLKGTGRGGGGCINEGEIYQADDNKIFVKKNSKTLARQMFDGEYESLKAIEATNTVRVPKPLLVVDNPRGGAALVMEYMDIGGLSRKANLLGDSLARLHLHNIELEEKSRAAEQYVGSSERSHPVYISKFGFHVATCCGSIAQNNNWCSDWPTFYGRKLNQQVNLIADKYGDKEAVQLWSVLNTKLPEFFKNIEIKPSLLHGDLWSGNVGEYKNEPVIFDPSSFYGHHEFDLGIAAMFGGFSKAFWNAYHSVIPRSEGWDRRHKLYILFHNLNHWNHFGSGYRSSSLEIMKGLVK